MTLKWTLQEIVFESHTFLSFSKLKMALKIYETFISHFRLKRYILKAQVLGERRSVPGDVTPIRWTLPQDGHFLQSRSVIFTIDYLSTYSRGLWTSHFGVRGNFVSPCIFRQLLLLEKWQWYTLSIETSQ